MEGERGAESVAIREECSRLEAKARKWVLELVGFMGV
jgi:hypothetical protein